MDRCREIFERIIAGGKQAIEDFIADRKAEELFLDFKRSSDNGAASRLSDIDRKNLAKAISGFGNSEGGVVVWGVDCSRDVDGADVAKAKFPIENPKRFASLLQGVISSCTVPPHSGVENKLIEAEPGLGFVITLIPKSDFAPHQMLPNKQYYIRAGSDFLPTPHDVLAGMFGRRPQPHVFHQFVQEVPVLQGDDLEMIWGLFIHNKGPGIASDIYALCEVHSKPGPNCNIRFNITERSIWTGGFEFGNRISLISVPGYRLPPGANTPSFAVNFSLKPPFQKNLKISGHVGSTETRSYFFTIENDVEVIREQYDIYKKKFHEGTLDEEEQHKIASLIIGKR